MKWATDENFDGNILRGLLNRLPALDIVRVQDTVMYQRPDSQLLSWLAQEGRILLTHDVNTMPDYVYQRVRRGQRVVGVIIVRRYYPLKRTLDDLELLLSASDPSEFENLVRFVPLQ